MIQERQRATPSGWRHGNLGPLHFPSETPYRSLPPKKLKSRNYITRESGATALMKYEVPIGLVGIEGSMLRQGLDFASCALNRTFSATWLCRQQRLAMNNCMISHASQQEQDAAREEWFATRDKRKREREEKEKKRKEHEQFHRAWWGMPPLPDDEDKATATEPKR